MECAKKFCEEFDSSKWLTVSRDEYSKIVVKKYMPGTNITLKLKVNLFKVFQDLLKDKKVF